MAYAYNVCESTAFIEFMLETIRDTLLDSLTCSGEQVKEQVEEEVRINIEKLLEYCKEPRTRTQMQEYIGVLGRKKFISEYLKPLLSENKLAMTIPDKPTSRNQKYYIQL